MKLFKNIFGTKPNEISKYEPNTLAEINQSPDERNRAADQNETEKPAAKPKEQKNNTKATVEKAKSAGIKTSDTSKSINPKSTIKIAGADRIVYAVKNEVKNSDVPSSTKADNTKKSSSTNASKVTAKTNTKTPDKKPATKATPDKNAAKNVKSAVKPTTENNASIKAESKATVKKANASSQSITKPATKKSAFDAKADNVKTDNATKNSTTTSASKPISKKQEVNSKATTKPATKTTTESKSISKPAEKKPTSTPKATEKSTTSDNKSTVAKSTSAAPKTKKKTDTKATAKVDTKANTNSNQSKGDEITEVKATRTGKFEIKKSKDGRYVFNLYASNNVIVATSQVYSSSTSALNGIKSVVANANAPIEDQSLKEFESVPYPKWEIYRDKGDQYRFRLCASNGSCVCHSQGYTSKTNCKKGIESIIKFAGDAEITKAYLDKKEK